MALPHSKTKEGKIDAAKIKTKLMKTKKTTKKKSSPVKTRKKKTKRTKKTENNPNLCPGCGTDSVHYPGCPNIGMGTSFGW